MGGKVEGRKRKDGVAKSAEGARCGEGCPNPTGEGSGTAPSPKKFFDFRSQNVDF